MRFQPPNGILRIGVAHDPPEAESCFKQMPQIHCKKPGYEVELFHETMKYLGWEKSYEFVEQTPRDYGFLQDDGSWSGLIGMLVNGTIDMTALTMRFTGERYKAVDFGFPINYYQQVYFVRQPSEYDYRNFIFIPFSTRVWLMLVLSFGLAASMHALIVSTLRLRHVTSYRLRIGASVYRSFWDMYAIGMRQNYRVYRYLSGVMLAKIWIFFCLVISQYYQSNMHSLLSAPLRTKMPFANIVELTALLETNDWHVIYPQKNVIPNCPPRQCDRLEAALANNPLRIVAPQEIQPVILDTTTNYVYFAADDRDIVPHDYSIWQRNAPFLIIKDNILSGQWVSFAFGKNQTRLMHRFNEALVNLLPAIDTIKRRYRAPWLKFDNSITFKTIQIRMEHILQIFQVYMLLSLGSILGFLLEHAWFRYHKSVGHILSSESFTTATAVNHYWRKVSRFSSVQKFPNTLETHWSVNSDKTQGHTNYNTQADYHYFTYQKSE